jgi:hypothetical protein
MTARDNLVCAWCARRELGWSGLKPLSGASAPSAQDLSEALGAIQNPGVLAFPGSSTDSLDKQDFPIFDPRADTNLHPRLCGAGLHMGCDRRCLGKQRRRRHPNKFGSPKYA